MIFIPNESKKVVTLLMDNKFTLQKELPYSLYTLNNTFLLSTPSKTIVYGKTKLVLQKNIFSKANLIVEIKNMELKLETQNHDFIEDKESKIRFSCTEEPEKIVNVGHLKINNIFRGTYVWCYANDTKYFTNLLLPHFKDNAIYKKNEFDDFLLDLVKQTMQKL